MLFLSSGSLPWCCNHHFIKQPDQECVQLLCSHFSHPFGYHFHLFCLWNISQVWLYCHCADSGCHPCFLCDWQLSLLTESPWCQHCLSNLSSRVPENEGSKTIIIIFQIFQVHLFCVTSKGRRRDRKWKSQGWEEVDFESLEGRTFSLKFEGIIIMTLR